MKLGPLEAADREYIHIHIYILYIIYIYIYRLGTNLAVTYDRLSRGLSTAGLEAERIMIHGDARYTSGSSTVLERPPVGPPSPRRRTIRSTGRRGRARLLHRSKLRNFAFSKNFIYHATHASTRPYSLQQRK